MKSWVIANFLQNKTMKYTVLMDGGLLHVISFVVAVMVIVKTWLLTPVTILFFSLSLFLHCPS